MAVQSYLSEAVGGMVAAAAFADDDGAVAAVDALHASGVRAEDISVIAPEPERAERVARSLAWTPGRRAPAGRVARILRALPRPGGLPRELRKRYRTEMADGSVVVIVAAGGQPADTLEALLTQAGGRAVQAWWMKPAAIFAPPELAGPF